MRSKKRGGLFDNLVFGVFSSDDPDGKMERVVAICEKLQMSKKLISYVKQGPGKDAEQKAWGSVLSSTQQMLCMHARAFIANPEVLVVHKPTMAFDEWRSHSVMRIFQRFVIDKGVMQDEASRHLRRPRTAIMTVSKAHLIEMVDRCFEVSTRHGLRQIEKQQVLSNLRMLE
eukprot:gnl/TRDRNA2_/TRDRNA2_171933_c1_seq1.p1 gnl/TRDRNA2_/TRDRNA2_171933_c1~~gnl/TRDRNA2_/TRDRNA2_171933_c1_seq1.p1  ORF type:complete len:172 (-),score=23.28 gnl/TRDRNA2_/TRDRNA2_171933_c1_seq1:48-563(-)